MSSQGTNPGGPSISSAKKRRLAALERNLGQTKPDNTNSKPVNKASTTSQPTTVNPSSKNQQQSKKETQRKRPRDPSSSQQLTTSHSDAETSTKQRTKDPPELVYAPLPDELRSGPIGQALGIRPAGAPGPCGTEAILQMFEEMLATNPRPMDPTAVINSRLKDKVILLENPVGGQLGKKQKQGRNRKDASAKDLGLATRSKQKKLGLYDLKNAGLTYAQVMPLHDRWQQYFKTLTQEAANMRELQQRIYESDLHGCLLSVVSSNQVRLQGLKGIVVRDTQQTVQLVTEQDRFVIVPKAGCVFEYALDAKKMIRWIGDNMPGRK